MAAEPQAQRLQAPAPAGRNAPAAPAPAPPAPAPPAGAPVWQDPKQPPAARARDLVGRLTLDEKVTQLHNLQKEVPRLGLPAFEFLNGAGARCAAGTRGGGAPAASAGLSSRAGRPGRPKCALE
jgi:hypothetical protein